MIKPNKSRYSSSFHYHFYKPGQIDNNVHVIRPAIRHVHHKYKGAPRGMFNLNASKYNNMSASKRVHRKQWLLKHIKNGSVTSVHQAAVKLHLTRATVLKYLRELRRSHQLKG